MAGNQVTYMLDSMESGQNLRVSDFTNQIQRFRTMLTVASSRTIDWELVDVSRSNPVTFVAQSVLTNADAPDNREEEINTLFSNWKALQDGQVPSGMSRRQLEAFKDIAQSKAVRSRLLNGAQSVNVDRGVIPLIDVALAPKKYAWGHVDGRIEVVNAHVDVKKVSIFPSVGPKKVECLFDSEHQALVHDAANFLLREVRVFGRLSYPSRGSFPSSIQVERLEPLREDLADPNEVRGIVPNLTDGQPSEDYVRENRGGN